MKKKVNKKMKKKILLFCLSLVLLLSGFTGCANGQGSSSNSSTGQLNIGVAGEYFPFCYTENDTLQGFEIDVWNEIAKRGGFTVDFSVSDFTGLFGMLDSGKVDSIGHGIAVNAEREEKYLFSDPYLYSDYNLVTIKGSKLTAKEDFIGKRVGVVMGGEGERKLTAMSEAENLSIEVVGYEGSAAMDEDVQLERIDARLAPKIQTSANIKKNDLNMTVTDIVVFSETDAYPFPNDEAHQDLKEKVNEILSEMREDGTLAKLSEKWFGLDATNP